MSQWCKNLLWQPSQNIKKVGLVLLAFFFFGSLAFGQYVPFSFLLSHISEDSAPGAFLIQGAAGGTDNTKDAYLTDGTIATIHWGTALMADSYDVSLRNTDNTSIAGCSPEDTNTTSTSYTFSGCTLSVGTSYKVTVTAKNGSETTNASNSPFTFTVTDPTPSSFAIMGIKGGTDTASNEYLTDAAADPYTIEWETSSSGVNYTVTIKTEAEGDMGAGCTQSGLSTLTTDFTQANCPLSAGTDYRLYVTADNGTETAAALNNGMLISVATSVNCAAGGTTTSRYIEFYDDGGPNNTIGGNCDLTVNRTATEDITITYQDLGGTGALFDTKSSWNADVYQGTSTAGTLVGSDSGLFTTPFSYIVTQDMHFNFTKSGGGNHDGWQSTIVTSFSPLSAFNVLGALSADGGVADSTADEWLTSGNEVRASWQTATNAVSYDASIWNEDSTVVCSWANTTNTFHEFTGCSLNEGATYTIHVVAKNEGGEHLVASTSPFSFTVDTLAPLPFEITGATGGTDTTKDEWLGNTLLTANWMATSGASSYEVTLLDNAGTPIAACTSSVNVTTTSHTFSDCLLVNGLTYKIRVVAKDAANRTTAANNNDFSFTVDTSAPASFNITGVTSTGAGTDTTIDNILTDGLFVEANWGETTGEDSYEISITDFFNLPLTGCDTLIVGSNITSAEMTNANCQLTFGETYQLSVSAKDAAGNTLIAANAPYMFALTNGPGPFYITGIVSVDGTSDTLLNNELKGSAFARVEWTNAINEDHYEIFLKDSTDTIICSDVAVATDALFYEFSDPSCELTDGQSYKIDLIAKDAEGDVTKAANSIYYFDVNTFMIEMVKDINQTNISASNPSSIISILDTVYFRAETDDYGTELWTSDGTAAGTFMIKNINPTGSSFPSRLTNLDGTFFFSADDGTNGRELWKSDGTEAGTVMVKDINSSGNPYLGDFTNVSGTLFFSADDGTNGRELWKSDGTEAGTVMVKDINPSGSSYPGSFTNVSGTLFFRANDGANGTELWKSDGTEAGTVMVKDINSSGSSNLGNFTNVSGTLFFSADDGTNGTELWKTDGTEAGTVMVKDINPSGSSNPGIFNYSGDIINISGTLFFTADDGTNGEELWKSDGTEAGTVMVKDINASGSSTPDWFINVSGTLFFYAGGYLDYTLWKSDGTEAGTVVVIDPVNFGDPNNGLPETADASGTLFFDNNDGTSGYELWKSDGTEAGTVMVKDINPVGNKGFSLASDTIFKKGPGTNIYFEANDGINGYELWKTDGTEAGTVMVKDIRPNGSSGPTFLTDVGGVLYFRADDGTNGIELWKSDGTSAGTVMVKDINTSGDSSPYSLTDVGGVLYFSAVDANGFELWKSDGTAAGTVMVKDINTSGNSYPSGLTDINGVLYFRADDGTNGSELWKSDGTAAGTVMVKDISAGSAHSSPLYLINLGGTLFFRAHDGTNGDELWKSDGTEAGTVMVKDINSSGSSSLAELTNVNGTLFFSAADGINGQELWKSDGTEAGTVMVKDIYAGSSSSNPKKLTDVNGTLFFIANDGTNGDELWKSDGTAAGTVMVKDINSSGSSSLAELTNVNGTLFFSAADGINGQELWESDGTEAGTVMAKDIYSGSSASSPTSLTEIDGILYFGADDGVLAKELWRAIP